MLEKLGKRSLSFLLILCMALSLMGGVVMADDTGETAPVSSSEMDALPPGDVAPVESAASEAALSSDADAEALDIAADDGKLPEDEAAGTLRDPELVASPEAPQPAAPHPTSFWGASSAGVYVTAQAPVGAFEEPVSMAVRDVQLDAATEEKVLRAADGGRVLAAVDITFFNQSGSPVEPAQQIAVTISAPALCLAENLQVIHVDTLDSGAVDYAIPPQPLSFSSVASDAVALQTDGFSIFAIVDADKDEQPALLTFTFCDEEGNALSVQTVKESDTLYEPAVPQTLANRRFIGWFAQGSDTPFTDFGPVGPVAQSASLRLTARYSAETVNVIYHDPQGNVVRTDSVPVNSAALIAPDSPLIATDSLTLHHYGWAATPGGTEDVSGSLPVGAEDIKLYPILLEGYWVDFESNGGTAVTSQFIDRLAAGEGRKAQEPAEPYREGYTFTGWYANEAFSEVYDFDTPVTAPCTIYARWTPNDNTQYKVVYWVEYQSDVENDLWDYKMVARIVNQATTGTETEYDPELIFKDPYKKETYGYQLNADKSETKTVAPDGSTVVNVYFDCQTRNVSVTFPDRDGNNVTVSAEDVKFTADMGFFWDMVAEHNELDFLLDGKHIFEFQPYSVRITTVDGLSKMIFYNDEVGTWYAVTMNLAYRIFYETLEGVAPDGKEAVPNTSARVLGGFRTDDRLYYEHSRFYTFGGASMGVKPGSPIGFRCFFKGSDGNYGYATSGEQTIWYHNTYGYGLDGSRDPAMRYEYNNDPDGFMDVYFLRNQYELNFHENGGEELEDQSVYYEKNISVYDPAVTNPEHYTPGVSTRHNPDGQVLTFAGWYTDFALTDPFDGFDLTMPAYNIDLYAKWAPFTYTVTFDSNGGSAVPPVTGVEYSQRVVKPEDPNYDGYRFLGWTLNGVPFSFESGITEDITLVAQWNSVSAYPVIYDLNGGTGTATTDKNRYYAGTDVLVLPPASDVTGPDGKVFLGWLADSDGLLYYPNGIVRMPTGALTLTAQWGEADTPTDFTYDFNYAAYGITAYHTDTTEHPLSGLPNNSSLTVSDFSVFGKAPDGYVFLGWNTKADGNGEAIAPGDTLWVDREEPLPNRVYAIWEKSSDPTPSPVPSPTPSPTPSPGPGPKGPKTGNTSYLPLYLCLMLVSGGATLWSLSKRRKRGAHER